MNWNEALNALQSQAGVLFGLMVVVVAFVKRWVWPNATVTEMRAGLERQVTELRQERDEWRGVALQGTHLARQTLESTEETRTTAQDAVSVLTRYLDAQIPTPRRKPVPRKGRGT